MLETKSAFPHQGSTGFLKPDGEPVRIIQPNSDGSILVQRLDVGHARNDRATGTYTAEAGDVCEHRSDALLGKKARLQWEALRFPASAAA